ncbi:MAG: aminoglycoside phosphotransferase family protein [Puniceicoccales bacterium]|nr:aminoglycoside phosphotransferase family protein [Puniceicoccales bacterium]
MNTAIQIAQQFSTEGRLISVERFGAGNVNDTYLAITRTTFSESRFVLQRIRKAVFPEPVLLMQNLRIVTDHCHKKLEAESASADRVWQLPKIIPAHSGADYLTDDAGDLWRALSYIAGATCYEKVRDLAHAREAGHVLGHFQRLISDIPASRLHYALPGFHVAPGYLAKLDATLATSDGRARLEASTEARQSLDFIRARHDLCFSLQNALQAGTLISRPTHGDPKIGNIMTDDITGKGTCILDLDTVQPGLIHYDLGDCMRSCCNPAGEDADDLDSVNFDLDLFDAIYSGYIADAKEFISDADRARFFDAIHLLPLELGIRFFADHLAGDVYFKTRYPGHNLKRALVQLRLAQSIESRESQIRKALDAAL